MKKYILYSLTGALSGIINGLFGAGGGMIVVPALEHVLKKETKTAHATAIAVILPISAVSAFFYLKSGFFDLNTALIVGIPSIVGGICGAIFLKKASNNLIRTLFALSIIITGVRMLCS